MLFLCLAALLGVLTIIAAAVPGPYWNCGSGQDCRLGADAANLLPDETLTKLNRDPTARRRFDAWVATPGIRIGLAAVVLLQSGPMPVLLFAVGMALRRLGQKRRNALADALPWLRRASRAAIVLAIAHIIAPIFQSLLLANGFAQPEVLTPPIMVEMTLLLLMLAFAAYATIWALEAGIRAERELADFV